MSIPIASTPAPVIGQCCQCPFFQLSARSPSCGFCAHWGDAVLGQDVPCDSHGPAIAEFWQWNGRTWRLRPAPHPDQARTASGLVSIA